MFALGYVVGKTVERVQWNNLIDSGRLPKPTAKTGRFETRRLPKPSHFDFT
jgi:hypothetical protein